MEIQANKRSFAAELATVKTENLPAQYTVLEGDPVPNEADIERFGAIDSDPMFITATVRPGKRSSLTAEFNQREEGPLEIPWDVVLMLHNQLQAEPLPGYIGHHDIFGGIPDIGILWFKSAVAKEKNDDVLLTTGYVYDIGKLRDYIRTQAIDSISVTMITEEAWQFDEDFNLIKAVIIKANYMSIDLVQKNTEGIHNSNIVMYNSVQGDSMLINGKEVDNSVVEFIKALSAEQLSQINPALALNSEKPTAPTDTQLMKEFAQMSSELEAYKTTISGLCKTLGCDINGLVDRISQLSQVAEKELKIFAAEEVAKIENPVIQNLVSRFLQIDRFSSTEEITKEIARLTAESTEITKTLPQDNRAKIHFFSFANSEHKGLGIGDNNAKVPDFIGNAGKQFVD